MRRRLKFFLGVVSGSRRLRFDELKRYHREHAWRAYFATAPSAYEACKRILERIDHGGDEYPPLTS
jgi:hypothetical protein